jgi:hypothetical protein
MAEQYARIEFEDIDDWYRVKLSPVPLQTFRDVVAAYRVATESALLPDDLVTMTEVFIPLIESWSHGKKVSVEKALTLDANLLYALVGHWINGVRGVPLPLRRGSSDGEPSEDPTTSPQS